MNDQMQAAMNEAARLTRAGRLKEATALIQSTLGGKSTPVERSTRTVVSKEANVRVVQEIPSLPGATIEGGTGVSSGQINASATIQPQTFSYHTPQPPGRLFDSTLQGQLFSPGVEAAASHLGGKFIDEAYRNAAGTRSYKLYIPRSYIGQAVPLVIMLHGCTQNAVDFAAGTRMNMFAEEKTLLVAYPEQVSSANNSKCWNWFQYADQQRDMGEPALIAGITRQIMNSYHVDVNQVYVAGMSAGGAMAVIVAVTYPDLYAAVGVHSGLAYRAAHDVRSGFAAMRQGASKSVQQLTTVVPLITFQGDRDTTVAPVNADLLLDQWMGATSHQRDRSTQSTKVEQGQVVGGRAYTCSIYHNTHGNAIAEKWLVHQAGHAWSGGSSSGSFTDPKGPDASTEMLRFFAEHKRER